MQKCATHTTQGRRKIWKIVEIFLKFNQKYDFHEISILKSIPLAIH